MGLAGGCVVDDHQDGGLAISRCGMKTRSRFMLEPIGKVHQRLADRPSKITVERL